MVNRPIREVLAVAGSMRQGDLTHSIDVQGRDEISHMSARMNLVNENLRQMIGEIAAASQSVAASASEQAAAIQETSSSLEELTAMSSQNSDNASQAPQNPVMAGSPIPVTSANSPRPPKNETSVRAIT